MNFYIILSVRLGLQTLSFHYACGLIHCFFHVQRMLPQNPSLFLLASLSLFSSLLYICIFKLKDCVFNLNLQFNCLNKQTVSRLHLSKNNNYKTKTMELEGNRNEGRGMFQYTVTTLYPTNGERKPN